MKAATQRWARCSTSLTLFMIFAVLAAAAQDATPPPELPDSPGTVVTEQKTGEGSAAQGQTQSVAAPKPVGTAAAEKPATTGVAASNAAGAAIAPARQRHTRSLIIKVGAILGAGVAIGTVAALSTASPNRPPGSH